MNAEQRARARASARAQRLAQGLGPTIEDPTTLAKIALLLAQPVEPSTRRGGATDSAAPTDTDDEPVATNDRGRRARA